eukprot:CAMPEP_0206003168 /NCGR_PEP_ID=MMETSP1464-20131121/3201_1 /ASSEMBLY_ACC=CAM_ASM_001124 /TAXON_ID=119497 /ORGANISM="Exanthemachrysis gayraliae, Strain RCC1523" /LENGTH=282 /DNA_ID=CAMNT_0053376531 /DNA_START=831 /DNA_END=1676 /DNA_ORIENTATION=-
MSALCGHSTRTLIRSSAIEESQRLLVVVGRLRVALGGPPGVGGWQGRARALSGRGLLVRHEPLVVPLLSPLGARVILRSAFRSAVQGLLQLDQARLVAVEHPDACGHPPCLEGRLRLLHGDDVGGVLRAHGGEACGGALHPCQLLAGGQQRAGHLVGQQRKRAVVLGEQDASGKCVAHVVLVLLVHPLEQVLLGGLPEDEVRLGALEGPTRDVREVLTDRRRQLLGRQWRVLRGPAPHTVGEDEVGGALAGPEGTAHEAAHNMPSGAIAHLDFAREGCGVHS